MRLALSGWASGAAASLLAVSAAGAEPPAPATACGASGVAVQVLGSGGPELGTGRASAGYLVWTHGVARVLVDAGGGSALRFGQSGATMSGLSVILLTHLHADHTADLPALVKSSFFEERTAPLPIYGPAGNSRFPSTTQLVQRLFAARSGVYPYLSGYLAGSGAGDYQIKPHTVGATADADKPLYADDDLLIHAARVVHGSVPALAYRVDVDGFSVVFAGDGNGDNGNLERLARGADLLVAPNAVPEGATGVERALHMPPSVIGRIARDAGVGRLVLSHRMQRTLGQEPHAEASIRAAYAGSVSFADDLDCFVLSTRGTTDATGGVPAPSSAPKAREGIR